MKPLHQLQIDFIENLLKALEHSDIKDLEETSKPYSTKLDYLIGRYGDTYVLSFFRNQLYKWYLSHEYDIHKKATLSILNILRRGLPIYVQHVDLDNKIYIRYNKTTKEFKVYGN